MSEKKTMKTRIKEHFDRNKDRYTAIGWIAVGFTGGVVAYSLSENKDSRVYNFEGDGNNILENVTMENVEFTQIVERRGHPGIVVRCNETGEQFASINRASQCLGVSRKAIRDNLNGDSNRAGEYTFTNLGDADDIS